MVAYEDRRAFTLIELLTVISIIGILAAILMPVVSNAVDSAKKLKASRNLQQIAMAYASFVMKHSSKELNVCENAHEWAGVLSKYEELNVASIFISNDDYLSEQNKNVVPKSIGVLRNGRWQINKDFEDYPLSVVVIAGISGRAPASTTPIAYTRGLDDMKGVWRDADMDNGGVYGASGGFIVFLDGHVEFYTNLTDEQNKLVNYYTGEKTSKISEAVNYGARALSWTGVEWVADEK